MLLRVNAVPEPIMRATDGDEQARTRARLRSANRTRKTASGPVPLDPGVGTSGERSDDYRETLGPIGGSP